MDGRTAQFLQALDGVGADLLVELLSGPRRESELTAALSRADQSTVNRRLHALQEAVLLSQEAGRHRAPGREWQLNHAGETEGLLAALLALMDAVATRDHEERAEVRARLRLARARQVGLREVRRGESA